MEKLEYHPLCLLCPPMTAEEFAALKQNMVERVNQGLPPLEQPIRLFEKKILDGRHKHKAWDELDQENACEGYFTKNKPLMEVHADLNTLGAWLKVKSLNLVHRNLSADQRAAIFLDAAELSPEIKAAIDAIKEESAARQKAGKPVAAGDQRGSTAEKIADLAGVGATTVKQVGKLKKEAPEKFKEVAQGKTSAKKALKDVKKKTPQPPKTKPSPAKPKEIEVGDTVYQIVVPSVWSAVPSVTEQTVKAITAKNLVCAKGRIKKTEQLFLSLDDARKGWRAVVDGQISRLKDAAKEGPAVQKGK